MDKLYTVREVASILTVDEETVRRYLNSGLIEGIKLNRYWRVSQKELERFLCEKKVSNDT